MMILIFILLWLLCGGMAVVLGVLFLPPNYEDRWSVRFIALGGPVGLLVVLFNIPLRKDR